MSPMRLHIPGMDERPRIERDLSNWDAVSAYYAEHGPNVGFQKAFHVIMDRLLVDPHTVFAPGAEEGISEHLASGDPTILAMTHHSWFDPSNDAAAMEHEREVFGPIIGKFVVPARMDYFAYPVIGPIIAIGGAKPMARKKDLANYYASQGRSKEEIDELLKATGGDRKASNDVIQRLMVDMAMSGLVYASYIEGTRNRGDQTELQPVRGGIKDLLEAMEKPEDAKIITLSHDYGGARILPRRFLTPTIYFNIVDAPADPEKVNDILHDTLESGMHRARENRRPGAPLSPLGKAISLAAIAGGAAIADRLMTRD
jgi:acyltransferase-like protein